MSVRIVITDPPELDLMDPETVATSFTARGSCRPDDAEVEVTAKSGLTEYFRGDATVSNGEWEIEVTDLPEGAYVSLLAKATAGFMSDTDPILVLTEDSRIGPPVSGQGGARHARRR